MQESARCSKCRFYMPKDKYCGVCDIKGNLVSSEGSVCDSHKENLVRKVDFPNIGRGY